MPLPDLGFLGLFVGFSRGRWGDGGEWWRDGVRARNGQDPSMVQLLRPRDDFQCGGMATNRAQRCVLVDAVSDLTEAGRTGRKVRDVPSANPTGVPAMVSIEPVPDSDKVGIQVKAITGRALWLFSLRHVLTETVRVLLTHRWTILRMLDPR